MKPYLLACVLIFAAAVAHAADHFNIAVTVDDLPVHGPLPEGTTRLRIAESYLVTLKAHHVPQAYGFVNAQRIHDEPASEPVLDAWRKAGYPLANHTYSHLNLNDAPSLQAWLADLQAGEPALESRMPNAADWHYLRYPYLEAGADRSRHDGAIAWLHSHGYRIADVSVSFDDWAYSDAYARCLAKGDTASVAAMKTQYLKAVDDGIVRMKALSQRVYGRMIPQVLLTHIGAWSAATLPDVLARLDAAGAHYVPLAQAQADAAYRDAGPTQGNGTLMERAAATRGIDIAGISGPAPSDNLAAMCR